MGQSKRRDKPRCSKKCGGGVKPIAVWRTENWTYVTLQCCGCGHTYTSTSPAAVTMVRAYGFDVSIPTINKPKQYAIT